MKTQLLTITILLVINFTGLSQGFLEGNPRWHIREVYYSPSDPGYSEYSRIYQLGRDSSVGGLTYYILSMSDFRDTTLFFDTNILLRESRDTVYYRIYQREGIFLINRKEFILDFETIDNCKLTWSDYDSISSQGRTYFVNEYEVRGGTGQARLIESVGYEDMMFWETLCVYDHPWHNLRCQYRNGRLVYKEYDDEPCYLEHEIFTSTNELKESGIDVYPTKLSLGMNVHIDGIDQGRVIMWNLQGERLGVTDIQQGIIQPKAKGMIFLQIMSAGRTAGVVKIYVE